MSETPAGKIPGRALFIVGNEACERFSYYGMSAVLTLYMTRTLHMQGGKATMVSHLFKTGVYLLPLLGALLADRWLGRHRTIACLSLFYCLGHAALAAWEGSETGLYVGLALIALGAGGIKPCVAAFVGDQFEAGDSAGLARVYGLFYWAINLGSFSAFALIPWIRDAHGYAWAFGVPGLAMGAATLVFLAGSRTYRRVPPTGRAPGFLAVFRAALTSRDKSRPFWDRARGRFDDALVDGCRRVGGVIALFSPIPVFWALFDQTSTTWVLQGSRMTPTEIPLPFLDRPWRLDAESIQTLNPLLVMALIPLCVFVLYPAAERLGLKPSPLRRMTLGMALAALAFVASAWIQWRLDGDAATPVLAQAVPYLLLTAGEVLFSTTGLEFAFTEAPATMKSTLMSFWMLTTAAGNLLVAVVAHEGSRLFGAGGDVSAAQFLFYAALMALVTGVFAALGRRYRLAHGR